MKVEIDGTLCSGHGRCFVLAEDVYRLDDEGYNADRDSIIEVVPGHEAAAELGMRNCPEGAIATVDD
ncbi:ferredoxin [Rhodococcus rhodochrous]|uniref:Ferredoxin n=1 Tax=Rhodococcus rhodochrous TaxID=1829 RepID=A0AA46WY52_RHORH|nr:ferredoxin [Rhodococcus rhodochrous]UZF45687.1 ferredoxin [Rhodococcus rhodochrous]